MWEGRARSVRRELAALAAAGSGVADLHAAAIELVDRIVPAELTCWASLDPDTAVISSMTSGRARIPGEYEPLLATYEYNGAEPHTFAQLARRPVPVARLSDLPRRERERSGRWARVWRPLGLESELRVGFRADGVCWAAAGLVRRGEFSDREVEFLTSIGPALAAATRLAALARGAALAAEPAIVVVGPDGRRRGATEGAGGWESEVDSIADGRFEVLLRAAAAGARSAASGTFRARVRDARGGWIVVQVSRLVSDDDAREIAVTIRRASGEELLDVLLAAFRLTAREREVCREVLSGLSTSDIAARLGISANTVQDHLKSGPAHAKYFLLSGELVDAARAREIGLVNDVFPAADLESATARFAGTLCGRSQASIRGMNRIIEKIVAGQEKADDEVEEIRLAALHGEDYAEGVDAFLNRRAPEFTYR